MDMNVLSLDEFVLGTALYEELCLLGKQLMAKFPLNCRILGSMPNFLVEYLVELPERNNNLHNVYYYSTIYRNGIVHTLNCKYFNMELNDHTYAGSGNEKFFDMRMTFKQNSCMPERGLATPGPLTPNITKYIIDVLTKILGSYHEFDMIKNDGYIYFHGASQT